MILSKARDFAQDSSRQPVKEAVITIPPFFNQGIWFDRDVNKSSAFTNFQTNN